MIHVFEASTLFQVASLAAMLDDGVLATGDERRVLLLMDSARQPELVPGIAESPGFEDLAARFDEVVDFGATLWPLRPHQFAPRRHEFALLQSLMRQAWGFGEEPVTLYLESLQVNPSRALAAVFASSPLVVHADGLMSYGPTRNRLAPEILQRVRRLAYLDLVPGLRPLLLAEAQPALSPASPAAFGAIVEGWAAQLTPSSQLAEAVADPRPAVLILGQYLSDLGVVSAEEEEALSAAMLDAAEELGGQRVVFKPHPAASVSSIQAFLDAAAGRSLDTVIVRDAVPAEVVAAWLRPVGAVSLFSTSLATLRALFEMPVRAVGTHELMHALSPYENSNRVPLVLADALYGDGDQLGLGADPALLQGLIDSVGFAMRSAQLPWLRGDAEAFLGQHPQLRDRYIKQRRLRALGLPAADPRAKTGRELGRAHRAVHGVIKDPVLAERVLRAVRRARDQRDLATLRATPRKAAGALGSRLVSWSKRG